MTTETTTSGWLLVIAGALVLLGAGVIAYTRSARAERKAVAIVTESPEARRQRLFDSACDVSLDIAAHAVAADARLSSVASVIPIQRDGRWS